MKQKEIAYIYAQNEVTREQLTKMLTEDMNEWGCDQIGLGCNQLFKTPDELIDEVTRNYRWNGKVLEMINIAFYAPVMIEGQQGHESKTTIPLLIFYPCDVKGGTLTIKLCKESHSVQFD